MDMQLEVIYEDDNLAALNKPYGVNFDWAIVARPELLPVHRLDKDTSGIILFAKNAETQEYFKKMFQNREIKKTYLTLVVGEVKDREGVIDLAIGRSKKTPLKRVAIGEQRGKIREAVTEYEVIKKIVVPREGSGLSEKYTFLKAYPKTGRTHQIRSHFAAIGHPVVCDKLYAGKKFICPAGLTRQFLHAAAIEFTLQSGSRLRLEADLPEDLEETLKQIR
ncbi:MAG: RluA family pseudouridine synthase [bacterium]|nr:RluA family pseudouridine synthase [bacterium]